MKKKGFTLIEVLAVIVVLVAIFLVTLPNVTRILKNNQDKEYQNFVDDLCLKSEYFIQNLPTDLKDSLTSQNEEVGVCLEDLNKTELLRKDTIDPSTDEKVNLSQTLFVRKDPSTGKYVCRLKTTGTCTSGDNNVWAIVQREDDKRSIDDGQTVNSNVLINLYNSLDEHTIQYCLVKGSDTSSCSTNSDTGWTTYTTQVRVTGDNTKEQPISTLLYRNKMEDGTYTIPKKHTFAIDKTAPTVTFTIDGVPGDMDGIKKEPLK